jgi:dihydroxy-acid dehydratase
MTALYLERYLNFGLSREELQSGRPIIGIAQTGSDLSPCNRHHLELAKRVREGIREPAAWPSSSRSTPSRKPASARPPALDRNLAYLGLVEVLYGYPLDGVVLTIGCDKTTPGHADGGGDGEHPGDRPVGRADAERLAPRRAHRLGHHRVEGARDAAAGEIDYEGFIELVASSAPSTGYCNTMGTATTMNSLAEALGMQLPGSAAIPAPYRERRRWPTVTGQRIVDMVART